MSRRSQSSCCEQGYFDRVENQDQSQGSVKKETAANGIVDESEREDGMERKMTISRV